MDAIDQAGAEHRRRHGPPDEAVSITDSEAKYSLPCTDIHTLEALVEYFQIDLTKWKCKSFVANKWEMGAKDDHGRIATKPLFQVKAWFVPNVEGRRAGEEILAMIQDAKKKIKPAFPAIRTKPSRSGNLAEISIMDHHLGKLSWGKETGGADYDLAKAKELYVEAAESLIAGVSHYEPEKYLFVVGNDFFQMNGLNNTTFGGTSVDVDSRYPKVFTESRRMLTGVLHAVRQRAPVDVVVVPGNHDRESAFHLGDSLECWFKDDSRVNVNNEPRARKYIEWGLVMLMLTHGHKGKKADFPLISAVEQREMFGRTRFNEVHLGHWHKRQLFLDEMCGIPVRILPSLCPPDAWHAEMGFVGNLRAAEGYVWNKERGLVATVIHSLKEAA